MRDRDSELLSEAYREVYIKENLGTDVDLDGGENRLDRINSDLWELFGHHPEIDWRDESEVEIHGVAPHQQERTKQFLLQKGYAVDDVDYRYEGTIRIHFLEAFPQE